MPPAWDVLGIGENSIDHVYRLPDYPRPGPSMSKLPITSHQVFAGGQVATTLCTCAALGLRSTYLGVFGSDDNGRRAREEMTGRGVDLGPALVRRVPNRHAVILVDDRSGERIVLWQRDPVLQLEVDEARPEIIRSARLLHVDNVDEDTAIHAADIARLAQIPVTCDIDRVTARTPELMAAVSFPILAEHVPSALTGEGDVDQALRALRQRHPGWLCVTLGARGALLFAGDRLHQAPGVSVDVVDSTGAGDVFRGAFIAALLRGDPPAAVLRFANAAAALSCTRAGAIASIPSADDVAGLLRQTDNA